MTLPGDTDDNMEMVPCNLCSTQVWIRKDRLEAHVQKVHSPAAAPRKSFTTYKARIASNFPPRLTPQPVSGKLANLTLTSRTGQRTGKGLCAECGLEQPALWHYSESNHGPVDICAGCKPQVFLRSFG